MWTRVFGGPEENTDPALHGPHLVPPQLPFLCPLPQQSYSQVFLSGFLSFCLIKCESKCFWALSVFGWGWGWVGGRGRRPGARDRGFLPLSIPQKMLLLSACAWESVSIQGAKQLRDSMAGPCGSTPKLCPSAGPSASLVHLL